MARLLATLSSAVMVVAGPTNNNNSHHNSEFSIFFALRHFASGFATSSMLTLLVDNTPLSIRTVAITALMETSPNFKAILLHTPQVARRLNNTLRVHPSVGITGEGLVAFEEDSSAQVAAADFEEDSRMLSGTPTPTQPMPMPMQAMALAMVGASLYRVY